MIGKSENVRLRSKKLKDGRESLYLDIYVNGRRTYEFLGLYIIEEKSRFDKERNKTTRIQADMALSKKVISLQQEEWGVVRSSFVNDMSLLEYILQIADKKKGSTRNNYIQLYKLIEDFGDIKLQKANVRYVRSLIAYARNKRRKDGNVIMDSTIRVRLDTLCSVFNHALRSELIVRNPVNQLSHDERPKMKAREREYLTIDEVNAISKCERFPIARDMFLFSCFTGLRFSDIISLSWSDIKGDSIHIRQKKTSTPVIIPLSDNAKAFLPPRGIGKVFPTRQITSINYELKRMAEISGIGKHISFHVARHTFATLLLTYDVDIYVVSRLMGHADVSTTEIYAKVIDKRRENAVNKIPQIDGVGR